MKLPRSPRVTAVGGLITLLGLLLIASILNTRESLVFCERALYEESKMLERETNLKAPVKFSDICPEVRARAENSLNKWLEVILAMLIQFHPPQPPANP
jgi:predicted HicB family RNase H-like nuclease